MNLDLVFEELLPHPVEVVWGALTDANSVSDWLMLRDGWPGRLELLKRSLD